MIITFKTAFPKKEWTITNEKILFKGKEILLSEITKVQHDPTDTPIGNGVITVFYGEGFLPKFLTLPYPYEQKEDGEKVYEYILGIVGGEAAVAEERKNNEIKEKGYKKRCNVCGHIFCYTLDDLKKNKELKKNEMFSSAAALIGGFTAVAGGGLNPSTATANQTAEDLKSRIIDYDKCPSCGSRDLYDVTDEEIQQLKKSQNAQPISTADELKKFKELLDIGAITQEEFDTKKKQLLGL